MLFDTVIVPAHPSKPVQKSSVVTVRYENEVEKKIRFSNSRHGSSLAAITVVKPDSPVPVALLGKKVGDVCNLPKTKVTVIDTE